MVNSQLGKEVNNVLPMVYPRNAAPIEDERILEEAVRSAIEEFGVDRFARSLVESQAESERKAA